MLWLPKTQRFLLSNDMGSVFLSMKAKKVV